MIGKGEFHLVSGEERDPDLPPLNNTIFNGPNYATDPTDTVTLSTGIDVITLMGGLNQTIIDPITGRPIQNETCIEPPNANSFDDSGWYIDVDKTVVRTDGYQVISNTKVFDGQLHISNGGNQKIYANGNFDFHRINFLKRK
jgi:hypothetical protein